MHGNGRTELALPEKRGWEPLETEDHKENGEAGIREHERLARRSRVSRYVSHFAPFLGVFVVALFY